jgi:hypothetical protein
MHEFESSGHPSMSITDDKVVKFRQVVHGNGSHYHDLSNEVQILFGSCQTSRYTI